MDIQKYKKRTKNKVAESTLASRVSAQKNLEQFVDGGEPTVKDVEEWVDYLIEQHNNGEVSSATVREYFKAVRYYFETVKGEKDALDHIDWLPTARSDPGEYLTEDEFERVLEAARGYRDKAMLSIMYRYARRPREIVLLNKDELNLRDGEDEESTIKFYILKKTDPQITSKLIVDKSGSQGKSGREHLVMPATFELEGRPERLLEKYLQFAPDMTEVQEIDGKEREVEPLFCGNGGRISYRGFWDIVKRTVDRANIDKNITPKSFRHARATHLDWEGESPDRISREMLLHNPENTEVIGKYIHEREEDDVREVM